MNEPVQDPYSAPQAKLFDDGPKAEPPKPQSLMEQLLGVFTEPVEVFRKLRSAPSWLGAAILLMGVGIVAAMLWAHKVDQEAVVRHNMQVVEDLFRVPHNEAALQAQLDAVSGQPYLRTLLGTLIGTPIVFLIFSGILMIFARIGSQDEETGFKHVWALTWVHNLATVPISILAALMCLLKPVGGASNYILMNPANLLFFVNPENPLLRGLAFVVDPFYLYSFVLLYLGCKHTLNMKTWATVLALVVFGFFGFLGHFIAGIF